MSPTENGSIHGMSLLVGGLQSSVKALIEETHRREERAELQRQLLHDKFEEMRGDMREMKTDVKDVQQDVAEMKNEQQTVKETLADYQRNKVVFEATLKDVDGLKSTVTVFQNQEQRALGAWAVIRSLGKFGWTLIAALAIGGFTIFYQLILPKFL